MSHIWDGFRMDVSGLDGAMDVVDGFRPAAIAMMTRWNAKVVADMMANLVDREWIRTGTLLDDPLAVASQEVDDRRRRISRDGLRDPVVDPEFDMTLLRHQGRIYGLIHTEQGEWRRAWLSLPKVVGHEWWSGSDRPVWVSQARWNDRGDDWRAIIPTMRPADRGIRITLAPYRLDFSPEDVVAAMPKMDERRRAMARSVTLSRRHLHMLSAVGPHDDRSMVQDLVAWADTDEAAAERKQVMTGMDLPVIDLATVMGRPTREHLPEGEKEHR